jgi:hypothetical protein
MEGGSVMTNEPPKEPPALPDSYHHAHRAYAATAGLLLAWEFVGINLQPAGSTTFPATLKNPEAAPIVLAVLVAYFGVKTSVEWKQSDPVRRAQAASQVDFWGAHAIGIGALALYSIQRLFAGRVANLVKPPVAAGVLLAMLGGLALSEIRRYVKEGQTDWLRMLLFLVAAVVPSIIAVVGQQSASGLVATLLSVVGGFVLGQALWFYRKRSR